MKKLWWYKYKRLIYAGKILEAKKLLLKKIPKDAVIYKYYRGTNRDWNTITQNKLWLCQAGKFNDPYDCAFLYNCRSKEVYDRKTECELAIRESIEQFDRDKESKQLQESVFIACFSEKCDSILLWSHYGDEHRGICVGYNLWDLISNYNFFPVIYSNRMPKGMKADEKNTLFKWILTKSKDWSYENEWRLVEIDEAISGSSGKIKPFEKIKEIYIGKRQEEGIARNHERCKIEKNKNSSVDVAKIMHSEESYIDFNYICNYAKKEKIKLFDFDLKRSEFCLYRRKYPKC